LKSLRACAAAAWLAIVSTATAADATDTTAQLAKLKDPSAEVRIEALRELMTSLDPRLPEALFPLLSDEGNSIRRLAARAVGSRWWQIPTARIPAFTAALQRNAQSEAEDEQNMVQRGLGLLRRNYQGAMFARSANGRWVIYERHGLPCLIDTTTHTEELLGWKEEDSGWLAPAWGNSPLAGAARWHPKKDIVVLDIIEDRRASTIWAWQHGRGLRKLAQARVLKLLKVPERRFYSAGGFYTDIKDWRGDELVIELSYSTVDGEEYNDNTARLGWSLPKDSLRLISQKQKKTAQ
jgi:hypothetical protein